MRQASVVLAALALACPLIAVPGTGLDAYRLPVVLLIDAAFLALLFQRSSRGRERPPDPSPLRTAALILLGVQLLSAVFARSWAAAVAPILVSASGMALYGCIRGGLLRPEYARKLIPVVSAVALVVAAVGIGQKLHRVEAVATEGNRNYAGALCAMLLPTVVAFTRTGRPWERVLAAFAAAGLLAELLISESRGGLLGTLAGLSVAAWALWRGRVPRGAAVALIALVAVGGTFALTQGQEQVSQTRLDTVVFRLEAWKSGLRMLAKRPILGWGSGAFPVEYPPFRSAREFEVSHSDGRDGFKEVEDPHSIWINAAAETGVAGLLALLLVVYVAARLWRYYIRKAPDPDTAALLAGLGGGATAYLVAGGFNTLTLHVSHTMLFWGFLALVEVLGDQRPWRGGTSVRELRSALPPAAAVALLFGAFWTFRMGEAETAIRAGMSTSSPDLRQTHLREAIEMHPQSWLAHYELSRTLSAMGRTSAAVTEARSTLALRPHHVEALNQAAVSIAQSNGDLDEAVGDLRHAIEVAPFYYKSYFNLGLIEGRRDHPAEVRALMSKSIEHKPDHGASYYYRGLFSLVQGEAAPAAEDFRMARGLRFDVARALQTDRPSAVNDPRFAEFFK